MAAPAALIGSDLPPPTGWATWPTPNCIANPDNLKFAEDLRTLFIGEDSGMHVNNFFSYNVDTRQASSASCRRRRAPNPPLVHRGDQHQRLTYVMLNFQHPATGRARCTTPQAVLDPLVRPTSRTATAPGGLLHGTPSGIQLKA